MWAGRSHSPLAPGLVTRAGESMPRRPMTRAIRLELLATTNSLHSIYRRVRVFPASMLTLWNIWYLPGTLLPSYLYLLYLTLRWMTLQAIIASGTILMLCALALFLVRRLGGNRQILPVTTDWL